MLLKTKCFYKNIWFFLSKRDRYLIEILILKALINKIYPYIKLCFPIKKYLGFFLNS